MSEHPDDAPDGGPDRDPLTGRENPQDHRPAGREALSAEEEKARSRRNLAIAGALVAFVVFLFVVTVINLQSGVPERPL